MTEQENKGETDRFHTESPRLDDERSPFEIDRSRIIHSAAFRRLQGKTQVFGLGGSDFFRSRLTHSLEAAQIGKGIALRINRSANKKLVDTDLVEAACLAHDIGHPPFGHAGEKVLHEKMKDAFGGFEANAQNFRIVTCLEVKSDYDGLNLTRATLDALLKYDQSFTENKHDPKYKDKFYYDDDKPLVEWIAKPSKDGRSLECQIMNWADDIAYSTHDLEDGIKAGLITAELVEHLGSVIEKTIQENFNTRVKKISWDDGDWNKVLARIKEASRPDSDEKRRKASRKKVIGKTISEFIRASEVSERGNASLPRRYQWEMHIAEDIERRCEMMKSLVYELIINDEHVATLERKARKIIGGLFDEFTDPDVRTNKLYPADFRQRREKSSGRKETVRLACDYIAGMTDMFALKVYTRLREPDVSSIFEIL